MCGAPAPRRCAACLLSNNQLYNECRAPRRRRRSIMTAEVGSDTGNKAPHSGATRRKGGTDVSAEISDLRRQLAAAKQLLKGGKKTRTTGAPRAAAPAAGAGKRGPGGAAGKRGPGGAAGKRGPGGAAGKRGARGKREQKKGPAIKDEKEIGKKGEKKPKVKKDDPEKPEKDNGAGKKGEKKPKVKKDDPEKPEKPKDKTLEEELEETLSDDEIRNFMLEKHDMDRLTNRVCEILFERESAGMIQNELWKKLKISGKDGARLALKLERKGIIDREKMLEKGRWTYRLVLRKSPISTESIENAPCLTCPVEQRCAVDSEISPLTCTLIEDWVRVPIKGRSKRR